MARTELHPDARRPFARVTVVAFDLRRVHMARVEQGSLLPTADLPRVLAAFSAGPPSVLHGSTAADAVTQRVAWGKSPTGSTLLVALGEATTSASIAAALHHAGATQLTEAGLSDMPPKFVTVSPNGSMVSLGREAAEEDAQLLSRAAPHDFFHLSWK